MSLTQQVTHHLGKSIISGVYGDHNPVPSEAILCGELEVSPSVAREAVKSLAAKGLLASRARQGIRVLPESDWNLFDVDILAWIRDSNPSLELLRELAQMRIAVEPEAACLAAERQNGQEIALIGAALKRMKQAEAGLDDPLESDIAFHLSLLNASGNRFFMQQGRIVDTTLRVTMRFTSALMGVPAEAYADREKIYDAIVQNQPQKAHKESRKLVGDALLLIDAALDSRSWRVAR